MTPLETAASAGRGGPALALRLRAGPTPIARLLWGEVLARRLRELADGLSEGAR